MKATHKTSWGVERECDVHFDKYANGQNAIQLVSDGEPWATASVAIDYPVKDDEVAVKNYSENEGMVDCLKEAGIIGEQVGNFASGFVVIPIFKLLKNES